MALHLTRGQDPFVLYEHTHVASLHLLAQNLSTASVVLENPDLDQLGRELDNGYDYVAISFEPLHADRLLQMCTLVRARAPRTRIVLGGYGVLCLPELLQQPAWQSRVDHVCGGEGVTFIRALLGEPQQRQVHCRLPLEGATLPWLNPHPVGTMGIILSGLGCSTGCSFCATSALTHGRYLEVMDADQIYRVMRGYWKRAPFINGVTIHDDNLLQQRDKVMRLGRQIQRDQELGLRRLNYAACGSIGALSRYEPEELLLSGLDTVWVGVDSRFARRTKRGGMDPADAFWMLHSIGVKTVGAWTIGDDAQTPDNIHDDIDHFVGLDPTFQQLGILGAAPSTPLRQRLEQAGRIPEGVSRDQHHLYGETIVHRGFTHREMLALLDSAYRRIFHEQGPALMKVLEVNLNGYEWCLQSGNRLLRQHKSQLFLRLCKSTFPLLEAAIAHAPSYWVRRRLEDLKRRYVAAIGQPDPHERRMADIVLRLADREMDRRRQGPRPPREEPFRRYTYPPADRRPADRPYSVEYPDSGGAAADADPARAAGGAP
jgi:haloalkane dehalogenase